jgi:hypothetical protein
MHADLSAGVMPVTAHVMFKVGATLCGWREYWCCARHDPRFATTKVDYSNQQSIGAVVIDRKPIEIVNAHQKQCLRVDSLYHNLVRGQDFIVRIVKCIVSRQYLASKDKSPEFAQRLAS